MGSNLYDKINQDLKRAMISKDHKRVSVLKMLKSAILYAAVDSGESRDSATDDQVINILRKESKKREEASRLYDQAEDGIRAENERYEKEVIDAYLPQMLSEEEIASLVDQSIKKLGEATPKTLGIIISDVKNRSKGLADGALIAKLAKERISK